MSHLAIARQSASAVDAGLSFGESRVSCRSVKLDPTRQEVVASPHAMPHKNTTCFILAEFYASRWK